MNIRFSPAPRAAPSAAAPRPVVRDGAARCFRGRYAHLARIALTEDELEQYTEQLEQILEHAARVQALPTDGIEPTSHPLTMVNAFRSDEVTACLDRDEVLAEAPDPEDGYFRVPRILGDE